MKLLKWRKSTTAEAILKGGYDQAVGATTDKMVRDVQKTIRTDLFTFLATGTGTATGLGGNIHMVRGTLNISGGIVTGGTAMGALAGSILPLF